MSFEGYFWIAFCVLPHIPPLTVVCTTSPLSSGPLGEWENVSSFECKAFPLINLFFTICIPSIQVCFWCLSYSYVMQRHHLRMYILLYSGQVKTHHQISPSFRPVYRTMWRWSLLSLETTWNLPLFDETLLITTLWCDPYYCILSGEIIQLYSNSTNIRMTFLRTEDLMWLSAG